MKKRKVLLLLLLVVSALLLTICYSLQDKTKEIKTGKYVMQDTELEDCVWVELKDDNQFEFSRGIVSYRPTGTYAIEENIITLSVNENEAYTFLVDGDKLIFESGEYAENLVKKGGIFKLTSD